jgi:hypothetical protein
MLTWSFATEYDTGEFSQFTCCTDASAPPWVREAEIYVRDWALRRAQHVLAHRNGAGALVAVSAFDRTTIGIPLLSPLDHPGWHLQVVAILDDHQNQRLSREVFDNTFVAMTQLDVDRVFVTANVHRDHAVSLRACANVGLEPWIPLDDHYWILLGEVPNR